MKVHTNAEDMPLICDTCGMMFNQLIDFQTHSCIYLGTKHFEQEVCSAELPMKETCKLPVCSDVHCGFQWVVCKDGFNAGSVPRSQILPHSEEDPLKFQACWRSFQYTYKVGLRLGGGPLDVTYVEKSFLNVEIGNVTSILIQGTSLLNVIYVANYFHEVHM